MNRSTTTSELTDQSLDCPNDSQAEWNSSPGERAEKPRHTLKRLSWGWAVFGVLIVLLIAGGLLAIKVSQFKAMDAATAHQVTPPLPVNVSEVREEQLQPRVAAVGSVMAFQGTVVSTEAAGVVRQIR